MAKTRTRRSKRTPTTQIVVEKITQRSLSRNGTRAKARAPSVPGGMRIARPLAPPTAAGAIVGRAYQSLHSKPSGETCLRMTELVQEIQTSSTFSTVLLNLAPHSFSWLNDNARNYSKFRWNSCRFIYIPVCSANVSGQVAMGFQYDVPDPTPTSITQMSMMHGFVNTPVWGGWEGAVMLKNINSKPVPGSIASEFDTDRVSKPWYEYITAANFLTVLGADVTLGPVAGNKYSPGNLVIATNGGPATAVAAGNLYIQYEVDMIEPTSFVLNY